MLVLPTNANEYVSELMCIFANCVSLIRIAERSYDSLTNVPNYKGVRWRTLLRHLIVRTFGKLQCEYLMIDDPVISVRFAKWIAGTRWIFDSESERSILGLDSVLSA
jgi:hypothetical protein